jgi:ribosomal protein L11 methyltransferase
MNYTEVNFIINPYSQQDAEILTALLADLGFDSFSDSPEGVLAYIPTKLFSQVDLKSFVKKLPIQSKVSFSSLSIEDQNWNKQWESNFEPITVENFCRVRAPFHQPEKGYKLEITIEPKMAFGTGHHETTWLMIRELFNIDVQNKRVLDMGCGTGILAIVAEKLGAAKITAIDNDTWAFENAQENVLKNNCKRIKVLHGDATLLGNENYDVILANINLNILLNDIRVYINSLSKGGLLVMSGILTNDIPALGEAAERIGFEVLAKHNRNNWMLLSTKKI